MTGVERIDAAFAKTRGDNRAAFMPYHAMGYPNRDDTLAIIDALAAEGNYKFASFFAYLQSQVWRNRHQYMLL